MLKVPVYSTTGTVVGEEVLDERIFGVTAQPTLVHQVVVAEQANARVAIAHTKTKGEVRGGGKKPWAQKGTGRARHGSIRSPQWRGGGVIFGPRRNRNYALNLNKKMKRQALLMTLSDKVANDRLLVLDHLEVGGKTKDWQHVTGPVWAAAAPALRRRPATTLVVVPTVAPQLKRTTSNLRGVEAVRTDSLSVGAVLGHAYLMTTVDGIQKLQEWMKPWLKPRTQLKR